MRKKCTLYQMMIREANQKMGFLLKDEKKWLHNFIDSQSFEDVKKD